MGSPASVFSVTPRGISAVKPADLAEKRSQPAGAAEAWGLVSIFSPLVQAWYRKNAGLQLIGAIAAHWRSFASRAHSSAERASSSQPAGGDWYCFLQLSLQLLTALSEQRCAMRSH